jgi:SAM-dependent methyltransferase
MTRYVYRPEPSERSFLACVEELRSRGLEVRHPYGVDGTSPGVITRVIDELRRAGLGPIDWRIELERYAVYLCEAGYQRRFPDYYPGDKEMPLAHFLAIDFLAPSAHDIFIDVASENGVLAEIVRDLCGASTYSVDIMYPEGIHGSRIGADGCALPLPTGSVSRAAITDALQHFEEDRDRRLIREFGRVLRSRGRLCIVPLFLALEPAIQTDPRVAVNCDVVFDKGTTVYCAEGWGNRFGRFYSPSSLRERILDPNQDAFEFQLYHLSNASEIDSSVYARYALVGLRR